MECRHVDVCGRVGSDVGADGYCILHCPDPNKPKDAFQSALDQHMRRHRLKGEEEQGEIEDWLKRIGPWPGDAFDYIHFPSFADFSGHVFGPYGSSFEGTVFHEEAIFDSATFQGGAVFEKSVFKRAADFEMCIFESICAFGNVDFQKGLNCTGVEWRGEVRFLDNTFGADADFYMSTFHKRAVIAGKDAGSLVFRDVEANFQDVQFLEPSSVAFRNADFSQSLFLNTDLRDVEFTSVSWCTDRSAVKTDPGVCLYDEIAIIESGRALMDVPWGELARIYRRLKQSYEDQRDYGRGGNFHFREKEMMRRKYAAELDSSSVQLFLLRAYYLSSGYGERLWSAFWIGLLIALSALLYLLAGIGPVDAQAFGLSIDTYAETLIYSLQVTFFHRPAYLEPKSSAAYLVRAVNMIMGPVLIGLFALALRQRLRR